MSLTIAAAQSASVPGDVAGNVAHHLRFAALAAAHQAQLVVFPELSLTSYQLDIARANALRPDSPALAPLRDFAIRERMTLVAGAPMANQDGDLHIAAFAWRPDGSASIYAKQHVHHTEQPIFRSGPGGAALEIGEATAALAICADALQPQHAAQAAALGVSLYAVGAMVTEAGYARKAAMLTGYAREHRMTVMLANYSGITGDGVSAGKSAFWSEDGQLVVTSEGAAEELVLAVCDRGAWHGKVLPLPHGGQ